MSGLKIRPWLWAVAGLMLVGLVIEERGCGVVGPVADSPPFKVPDGVPIAMVFVAPDQPDAIQKMTSAQADVLGQCETYVKSVNGKWRLVQTPPTDFEEPWVRDAYAAYTRTQGATPPWAVAAGAKTGLNRAVPPDVKTDEVVAAVKAIK